MDFGSFSCFSHCVYYSPWVWRKVSWNLFVSPLKGTRELEGRLPLGSGKPESRQFPLVFLMLEHFLLRASLLRSLELLSTASLGQWEAGRKSWGQMCLVYSHAYSVPLCAAKQKFCHLTPPPHPVMLNRGRQRVMKRVLHLGEQEKEN